MSNDKIPFQGQAISATHRISDYHLGAGVRFANGLPNLLEDFKGDDDYVKMLQALVARFGPETKLKLEWAGDMIDYHAIPYRGAYASIPTVEAALKKTELCIQGHQKFWTATRHFLADRNHALDITIGNHDLEFAWPEVQERIRTELDIPAGDERLRFVTTVVEGDTCKLHGDIFDPPNANPKPEELFVNDRRGRRLLNVSYGNVLSASLLQALKAKQPWIGRMETHGAIWIAGLTREWRFGLRAVALWVAYVVYHNFFVRYKSIRRQVTLKKTFQLALGTITEGRLDYYRVNKFLSRWPEVRYLESGHTHAPGVARLEFSDRTIDWFNTGTGIEKIRLTRPEFSPLLTNWKETESFFRRVALHWRQRPLEAFGLMLLHLAAGLAPFAANWAFGWNLDWFAWAVVAVAAFSLLSRQSFAFYVADNYVEYNVLETIVTPDGRVGPRLVRFNPETGTYERFSA